MGIRMEGMGIRMEGLGIPMICLVLLPFERYNLNGGSLDQQFGTTEALWTNRG